MFTLRVVLALAAVLLLEPPQTEEQKELKELPAGPLSARHSQWLTQLKTAPPPDCFLAAESLAKNANSAVVDELIALAQDKSDDQRTRAGNVLARIGAKKSLEAAVRLASADKSAEVRKAVSSTLSAGPEAALLKQADLLEPAKKGLADKIPDVRFAFAMILAQNGEKDATPVLMQMLKDSDHHRRESAAESLAQLGDDAGAATLIKMLEYTESTHPLLIANKEMKKDKEGWQSLLRIVDEERIRVCGYVEKLKIAKAKSAVEKLTASPNPEVAEAAKKALSALTGS